MEKKVEAILITPDNSTELLELKEFLKNHNIKSRNINSDLLEDLVFNDILINTDKSEEVSESIIFEKLLQ